MYWKHWGKFPELIESKEKAKAIISNWSVESLETKLILGEIKAIESELFMISGDSKSALDILKAGT